MTGGDDEGMLAQAIAAMRASWPTQEAVILPKNQWLHTQAVIEIARELMNPDSRLCRNHWEEIVRRLAIALAHLPQAKERQQ